MKLSIKHFKFLSIFFLKSFFLAGFTLSAYGSDYDQNIIDTAADREWNKAIKMAQKNDDKASQQLSLWMYIVADNKAAQRDSTVKWQDIRDVIEAKPDWPDHTLLKTVLEAKLPSSFKGQDALEWFDKHSPATIKGIEIYLDALVNGGQLEKIGGKLNDWWPSMKLKAADQKRFIRKYNKFIKDDVHEARLSRLIDRGHFTNARNLARHIGEDRDLLAEARIVLRSDIKSDKRYSDAYVSKKIRLVPDSLQGDVGLLYDRLKWRRVKDLDARASEILLDPPDSEEIKGQEKRWWRERHILIRRMLEDKNYQMAYDLASSHSQTSGVSYSDAEWMSGWIALSYLNEPAKALKHFYAMKSVAKTPITLARHYYWLGESFEALGDQVNAEANFIKSANFPTTYYGTLAAENVNTPRGLMSIQSPKINQDYVLNWQNDTVLQDLFNAASSLRLAGYNNSSTKFFLAADDYLDDTALGRYYIAQKAKDLEKINISVLFSRKAAMNHIFYAQPYAYPISSDVIDTVDGNNISLVHSIIRQESLFDQYAQSPVGAQGLMQLMPATAKQVSRELSKPYNRSWLKDRAEYNIALGSNYVDSLIERYGRYYPLVAAAYNAGPNRVDKWLSTYGDPRKDEISWVDWVELIPFSETRNYVMRVTEALSVYDYVLKGEEYYLARLDNSYAGLYYNTVP